MFSSSFIVFCLISMVTIFRKSEILDLKFSITKMPQYFLGTKLFGFLRLKAEIVWGFTKFYIINILKISAGLSIPKDPGSGWDLAGLPTFCHPVKHSLATPCSRRCQFGPRFWQERRKRKQFQVRSHVFLVLQFLIVVFNVAWLRLQDILWFFLFN